MLLQPLFCYRLQVLMSGKVRFEDIAKLIVFNKSEVIDWFCSEAEFRYFIEKLIGAGLIRRVRRDMYAIIDSVSGKIYADSFMIASKISAGAYMIMHSALAYHYFDLAEKHSPVTVADDKKFRSFIFDGIKYSYIKSPICGFVDKIDNGAISVTSKERTIIDCIACMNRLGGVQRLFGILCTLPFLDEKQLTDCLTEYSRKGLYKKAGYLFWYFQKRLNLSDAFFDFCKEHMNKSVIEYLTIEYRPKSVLQKEWALMAPSYVDLLDGIK